MTSEYLLVFKNEAHVRRAEVTHVELFRGVARWVRAAPGGTC